MLELSDRKWADFKLTDIFNISGTKCIYEKDMEQYGTGIYPHVCNSTENNGVSGFYNHYTEEGNVICTGDIVGWATYQPVNFSCGSHIQKLTPKFTMNRQIALFIVTAIRLETAGGKYGYGRLLNRARLKEIVIHLPVDDNGQPDYDFMEQYIAERESQIIVGLQDVLNQMLK